MSDTGNTYLPTVRSRVRRGPEENFSADGRQRQRLSTLTAPYSTDIVSVVGG